MRSRVSLAMMLICLLLSDAVLGVRWQGTGSGMNNTVLTEIWAGIESNLDAALSMNTQSTYSAFCKQISDRLNNRWDPAWNVVLIKSEAAYDTVLYGYAFNSQWMWFNGVPNTVLGSSSIATLIVWKDYNCQSWGHIGEEESGFTQGQKEAITNIAASTNYADIQYDIWKVASYLVTQMEGSTLFSSGAYTVIASQDPSFGIYGRICKMGTSFYRKDSMKKVSSFNGNNELISTYYGAFYVFQTR